MLPVFLGGNQSPPPRTRRRQESRGLAGTNVGIFGHFTGKVFSFFLGGAGVYVHCGVSVLLAGLEGPLVMAARSNSGWARRAQDEASLGYFLIGLLEFMRVLHLRVFL